MKIQKSPSIFLESIMVGLQLVEGEVVCASVVMVYWNNSEDGLGGIKGCLHDGATNIARSVGILLGGSGGDLDGLDVVRGRRHIDFERRSE